MDLQPTKTTRVWSWGRVVYIELKNIFSEKQEQIKINIKFQIMFEFEKLLKQEQINKIQNQKSCGYYRVTQENLN